MATNFLELASTLKNVRAKWLPEKKVNFMPCLKMTFEAIWGIFCIPLEVKVQISHGIH